jgi:hypothetical protein
MMSSITNNLKKRYESYLKTASMISSLFSDNDAPYINSRQAERIYCSVFNAKDISRSDCSADAVVGKTGVGIKTYLNSTGRTYQKIAEFNKNSSSLRELTDSKEISFEVARLRNERINTTMKIYGLTNMIYHCIVRESNKIIVFETDMELINISKIRNIEKSNNTIYFNDTINEYNFSISKSTLYKRFITPKKSIIETDVFILDNPYEILGQLLFEKTRTDYGTTNEFVVAERTTDTFNVTESIMLPLFSDRGGRHVPERSGLNQWNARGRPRDFNEIYIPIPVWINRKFPSFFPSRDTPFSILLPDNSTLLCKICQDNDKALMSNPNSALGEWLLRKVLSLNEGELLTYKKLEDLGIDTVEIIKNNNSYSIDFRPIGSFDNFTEEHKTPNT